MTEFLGDLRHGVRFLRARPEILAIELALLVAMTATNVVTEGSDTLTPGAGLLLIVMIPLLVGYVGWLGAQRVLMADLLFDGVAPPRDVVRLVREHVGRFVVLGLLVFAVFLPFSIVLVAFGIDEGAMQLLTLPVWLAIDAVLTFVTPALALETRRVRDATSIGWRMLADRFDAVRYHVLLPPLVLVLLPVFLDGPVATTVSLLSAPLLLVARGAVVAAYCRLRPVTPG